MLYPQNIKCVICGRDLFEENRYEICSGCSLIANVRFCPRCGRAVGETSVYCNDCMRYGRDFNEARAPFIYEGNAKKLVYGLKYGGKKYYAKIMAQYLADEYYKSKWYVDYVTFVPMHYKREKSRGYNQAHLIAEELSKIIGLPLIDTLTRIKFSDNFARLNRTDRFKEAEGSFECKGKYNKKSFILVDDVFTTGATTGNCAKELIKNGASDVYVLTFCTSVCRPDLY